MTSPPLTVVAALMGAVVMLASGCVGSIGEVDRQDVGASGDVSGDGSRDGDDHKGSPDTPEPTEDVPVAPNDGSLIDVVCRDSDHDGFADDDDTCPDDPADCDDDNPGTFPGATETCNGVDDDCDGQVDEGVQNGCGGCSELPAAPGTACGVCGEGAWTCLDADTLRCEGPGLNACGGCAALAHEPGEACGQCGAYTCRADGTVACVDHPTNACGGCDALPVEPGTVCGLPCGEFECNGPNNVTCREYRANACGGCETLAGAPRSACGECGSYACNGREAVVCNDAPCCTPDSNASLCTAYNATCGSITAVDNCGVTRNISCGSCGSDFTCTGNTCACTPTSCGSSCDLLGYPGAGCTNLAPAGAVTASGQSPEQPPNLASNENRCDAWNAGGTGPQWWAVDLQRAVSVSGVTLVQARAPADGETILSVETSPDGFDWTTQVSFDQTTHSGTPFSLAFPQPVTTRHVRVFVVEANSWVSFLEIAVFSCP